MTTQNVISQNPTGGTVVPIGSAVDLVVQTVAPQALPTVSIISPSDGVVLTDDVLISPGNLLVEGVSSSDPSTLVTSVQVSLNGGTFRVAGTTDGFATWGIIFALEDGLNTFVARVTDGLGQTFDDAITVTYQPPALNPALQFQGDSFDIVNFGNPPTLNNLQQGSILLFLNVQISAVQGFHIVNKDGPAQGIEFRFINGRWELLVRRATSRQFVAAAAFSAPLDQFNWMAATWDILNGGPRIYAGVGGNPLVDVSTAIENGSGAKIDDSTFPLVLGDNPVDTFAGSLAMVIDEVMVFNRDLSLAELEQQRLNSTQQGNLVLWSKLGENGPVDQLDLSGNGNHGIASGPMVVNI